MVGYPGRCRPEAGDQCAVTAAGGRDVEFVGAVRGAVDRGRSGRQRFVRGADGAGRRRLPGFRNLRPGTAIHGDGRCRGDHRCTDPAAALAGNRRETARCAVFRDGPGRGAGAGRQPAVCVRRVAPRRDRRGTGPAHRGHSGYVGPDPRHPRARAAVSGVGRAGFGVASASRCATTLVSMGARRRGPRDPTDRASLRMAGAQLPRRSRSGRVELG